MTIAGEPADAAGLAALADRMPGWTLVTGKGGVGKTTVAGALAVRLADRGTSTLLASLDPAHSLGDLFEAEDDGAPERLRLLEVDAPLQHTRFLERHGRAIRTLLDRGTYLDAAEIDEFLGLALPGVDEVGGILFLMELSAEAEMEPERVVLDMPPTGHTLRLLETTRTFRDALRALAAMESKHRSVAEALAGEYRVDEAGRFVVETADRLDALEARLRDAERTGFVVVASPGAPVAAETRRLVEHLREAGYPILAGVGNRGAPFPVDDGYPMCTVPRLEVGPVGADALRALMADGSGAARGAGPRDRWVETGAYRAPADRRIYLVAGKGGVGKSTAAAALAFDLRDRTPRPVTLLGVDPAGSLGDIVGATGQVEGIRVRELDPAAGWERIREEYRSRVETLFERVFGGGDPSADRAVVERLIDLAPPGIDEIVAVGEIARAVRSGDDVYVIDTAPTGHLLRLLAMPEIVREWTGSAMRLLRRYRDVAPLGQLGEDLLRLSRRMRELREVLSDRRTTAVYIVALPEALATAETVRLAREIARQGLPLEALLWNRTETMAAPGVAPPEDGEEVVLPLLDPPPIGPEGLRGFAGRWRSVLRDSPGSSPPAS